MKRLTGVILVVGCLAKLLSPLPVGAQNSAVLIVAVQTGGLLSASQEYIELANITDQTVDMSQMQLKYFSASPKDMITASRTIKLQGVLPPAEHYLLSTAGFMPEVNQTFSATLASAGGHLQLTQATTVLDMVGWGSAAHASGMAAAAPSPGSAILRQLDDSIYRNTGDNKTDFTPTAGLPTAPLVPADGLGLQLSELLPNPASPATDAGGEYIELNNTGTTTIQLKDYKLLAGPNLGKSFSFASGSLEPGQFTAFYVTDTKLALNNSGSRVQLVSPRGDIVSDVSYEFAKDGQAWAMIDTVWQWTDTPTPSAANAPTSQDSAVTGDVKTSTKATAKSKASVKKPTVKKGQVKAASTKDSASAGKAEVPQQPKLHNSVVAGVGSLALLYGAYEYRQDMASFYRKLRGNRKAG